MVVPSAHVVAGQATADLNFKARNGDAVCFRDCSVSQNSDDAIIIYRVEKYGGVDVFNDNRFEYEAVDGKLAAVPDHKSPDGLLAVPADVTFFKFKFKDRSYRSGELLYLLRFIYFRSER